MRTCSRLKTALERLAEYLEVTCEQRSRGATWQIEIPGHPGAFDGLEMDRYRAFARLTWYALRDMDLNKYDLREAVRWDPPVPPQGSDRYVAWVEKYLDRIGGSDTRMLFETYNVRKQT